MRASERRRPLTSGAVDMSTHASLLEEFVVDEERAVSFAWLARELGVSADAAKA